jgi:ATP adenylyltransferase
MRQRVTESDLPGCLGCDLIAGRRELPGGVVYETPSWVVNHVVGSMNLGTLILSPRGHIVAMADLDDDATAEIGPLLRRTARVVEVILEPEQTYVASWAHGERERKHLHIAVQPVTSEVVAEFGGARSEQLQARMLAAGLEPDRADIEQFCDRARAEFRVG